MADVRTVGENTDQVLSTLHCLDLGRGRKKAVSKEVCRARACHEQWLIVKIDCMVFTLLRRSASACVRACVRACRMDPFRK